MIILFPFLLKDHVGPKICKRYRSYRFIRLLGRLSVSFPVGSPEYSNDRMLGCSEIYFCTIITMVAMTRKTSPLFTTMYSSPSYSSFKTPKAIVQCNRLFFLRANRTSYSNPESVVNRYTLPDRIAGGVIVYDLAKVAIASTSITKLKDSI